MNKDNVEDEKSTDKVLYKGICETYKITTSSDMRMRVPKQLLKITKKFAKENKDSERLASEYNKEK